MTNKEQQKIKDWQNSKLESLKGLVVYCDESDNKYARAHSIKTMDQLCQLATETTLESFVPVFLKKLECNKKHLGGSKFKERELLADAFYTDVHRYIEKYGIVPQWSQYYYEPPSNSDETFERLKKAQPAKQ